MIVFFLPFSQFLEINLQEFVKDIDLKLECTKFPEMGGLIILASAFAFFCFAIVVTVREETNVYL